MGNSFITSHPAAGSNPPHPAGTSHNSEQRPQSPSQSAETLPQEETNPNLDPIYIAATTGHFPSGTKITEYSPDLNELANYIFGLAGPEEYVLKPATLGAVTQYNPPSPIASEPSGSDAAYGHCHAATLTTPQINQETASIDSQEHAHCPHYPAAASATPTAGCATTFVGSQEASQYPRHHTNHRYTLEPSNTDATNPDYLPVAPSPPPITGDTSIVESHYHHRLAAAEAQRAEKNRRLSLLREILSTPGVRSGRVGKPLVKRVPRLEALTEEERDARVWERYRAAGLW